MNEAHLNWAKSHDWGTTAFLTEAGTIGIYEDEFRRALEDPLIFSSFSELRAWAGY